ncbi:MAG TPA: DUF72 domain-containing protein [Armatimonadota bacterium]|jgi:uncharacterized protein YecE (DUF72 family)
MDTTPSYIGTSGWSYPTGNGKWRGIVYPPRWHGDELAYYSERFPAVEVNSSFYRVPSPAVVSDWAARTPAHFRFAVKLFQKFTHPALYARTTGASPEVCADDVAAMRRALDPLAACGKLVAVLAQYPESFLQTVANRAVLMRTLDAFAAYPLALELRHPSWDTHTTAEICAHFHAARVRLDAPCYQNLRTPLPATGPLEYWRFHGRNAQAWRQANAGNARYDYHYSAPELDALAEAMLQRRCANTRRLIFFNNHLRGQAVANALSLAARLELPLPYEKFSHLASQYPELRPLTGEPGGQLALPG